MRVIHSLDNKSILEKDVEGRVSFLLTNQLGDYLSLSNYPISRYQGWFVRFDDKMFKIIENLEIQRGSEVEELRNNFWNIKRKKGGIIESFFLPPYFNSLIYEASESTTVELTLDIKESYDNREFGRQYAIFETGGIIIVEYSQDNKYNIYLAIKPDILDCSKLEEWIPRYYQLDQERNSPPFERYVFRALKLKSKKIVFSVSRNKKEAIKEAQMVFKKTEKLKKLENKRIKKLLNFKKIKIRDREIEMAYICAQHSLNSLTVTRDDQIGIYAGLPWFFQFWARDELISLKALNKKTQRRILLKHFYTIEKLASSDAFGWLFQRANGLISKRKIKKSLIKSINKFNPVHIKTTWMDTLSRAGAIEIQALRLNMYKLTCQNAEKQLKKQVQEKFWNGNFLADAIDNFTIRPNIFLVAYIYPELLSKKEWIKCFENILPKLWLDWGGIATIDKTSPLFNNRYTGEKPKSYHNGDSWFYLNNLTALILYRFDKKKFKKYIDKILEASTKEILWQGTIGHHGELSSASEFKSEGSWAQAWSNALYIEAIEEILEV